MSSKVLTLLLSLAAQSGVYARPDGPRAIAEISTALVLLNAPSRAWAFVKYSPGSENVCGELCEWDAIAYRDEDDNPPSNPPSCGDRITFVINQEGKPALEACAQVAAEFPDICGMCEPIIPTDDWTDEPTPTPTAGPMPAPTTPAPTWFWTDEPTPNPNCDPCADVIPISSSSFPTIESDTC